MTVDISCARCERTIKEILIAVDGVKSVSVDIPAKSVKAPGRRGVSRRVGFVGDR